MFFSLGRVALYTAFIVFPLPKTLVEILAKNLVKSLAKDLVRKGFKGLFIEISVEKLTEIVRNTDYVPQIKETKLFPKNPNLQINQPACQPMIYPSLGTIQRKNDKKTKKKKGNQRKKKNKKLCVCVLAFPEFSRF